MKNQHLITLKIMKNHHLEIKLRFKEVVSHLKCNFFFVNT